MAAIDNLPNEAPLRRPVCRRWRQLCNTTPQLLRRISLGFPGTPQSAAKLQAFAAWLRQHASQHLQQLNLEVRPTEYHAPEDTEQLLEAGATAALVACGAAGSLTSLRLADQWGKPMTWTGAMQGLRRLQVVARGSDAPWGFPPGALSGLESLVLAGAFDWPVDKRTGVEQVVLPSGLTELCLTSQHPDDCRMLPSVLPTLTRLRTLRLASVMCPLSVLSKLPSLRRLSLVECGEWPPASPSSRLWRHWSWMIITRVCTTLVPLWTLWRLCCHSCKSWRTWP
ncbi:hypothetical protein ABPG75_003545 [Micractinium tetrahymenae]